MKQGIQGNVALTLRTSARIPATGPLRAQSDVSTRGGTAGEWVRPTDGARFFRKSSCRHYTPTRLPPVLPSLHGGLGDTGKSLWLQNLGCTFPWRCGIDNVSIQGMCTPPIGRRPKRTDGLQSPPCVPTPNNCAASVNVPRGCHRFTSRAACLTVATMPNVCGHRETKRICCRSQHFGIEQIQDERQKAFPG